MSPRRVTATLLLAMLLAGCGASFPSPSATDGVTTPSPSSPPPATASAATPEPTAVPSGEVAELERSGGPLPPGRYTRAGFVPVITFAITGAEWYAEQLFNGFFDVQQDVGSPDVIAVQFAQPSSIYGAGGGSVTVSTASEAAEVLRGHPGLTILDESESLIDEHAGVVLEVEHGGASSANVSLMMVPPGPLGIAPHRRLWVAFLDTDDGLLAVMVGGSVARWDEALAAAEPVLESVTIGD